jgi:hypothetical protein
MKHPGYYVTITIILIILIIKRTFQEAEIVPGVLRAKRLIPYSLGTP